MVNAKLQYEVRKPTLRLRSGTKTEIDNPPLLVMLHGYGSNELDLFSFASELPDELLIISLRAPGVLAPNSYYWYNISFDFEGVKSYDKEGAKASLQLLDQFLTEIKTEYQFDANNVFILGFSQGAVLSYAYAFNNPGKVQHVVALSGFIDPALMNTTQTTHNFDCFSSHGTMDPVIPIDWARQAPAFLKTYGIEQVYKEYPAEHGIAPQNFANLREWIEQRSRVNT